MRTFVSNIERIHNVYSHCITQPLVASLELSQHRQPRTKSFSLAIPVSLSLHHPNRTLITHLTQLRACPPSNNNKMASSQPQKPPLANNASQAQQRSQPGLRYPSSGKTIYHRPLSRSRTQELSQASFAYLFGEMVSYAQKRVTGIQDLEKRYSFQPTPSLHPICAEWFTDCG